ncbi:DUF4177 domain-containing protein [Pseudoruegeria sp. HB172150]|uniref:DUF4177 domain-containing protein n=1 Tax=Pseudoruegeria sp. HB172150 TaxID=2721164 RepID=UPI0015535480|nr:DUF4177 domain-containing protein [Pseudoruegeria sp. HB172150]
MRYEYKVVPAPKKARKIKGVKTTEDRFAHELAEIMNAYGADGWEYQRTDTLPCEERSGLTGRTTNFQNMLVFRRVIGGEERVPVEMRAAPVAATAPVAAPAPLAEPEPAPAAEPEAVAREEAEVPEFHSAGHHPQDAETGADAAPAPEETEAEPKTEGLTFSSRSQEGHTPRLGAARHPEASDKAPGIAAR